MNRAIEKPVIKCWEVNINKYQSLSVFGRYLPGLLEYIDVKCYGLVGCGSVRFGILNRFDGLNANLGHSTLRRHYLWIIYDQLFIITYFSGIYATWKNCVCIISLEQWPNDCNQRLYSILTVFFPLVSLFLRVCVHIICLEIALISINRIESHCICRLSLHFNFPFVMRIYIIAILIWTVCWRIRINDPENSTLLPFTNCLTSLHLPLTRSLFYLEKCQLHIWVFKVGIFNDFIS